MRYLLAFLLLLLPVAATAQDDRGFLQGLLEDALSAEGRSVSIQGFEGALSSRATIDRIAVSDPEGVWLSAEDVALVWSRSALLGGRIEIDEISVGRLALDRAPVPVDGLPAPEASGPFTLPELPVAVQIAQLDIARAEIGAPILGEAAAFGVTGSADLEGGEGNAMLSVERLDTPASLELAGRFDNETRALELRLALEEPRGGLVAQRIGLAEGESLALTLDGDGTLGDFAADLSLTTAGQERLAGTVALSETETGAQGFSAEVGGDLAPLLAPEYRSFLGERIALTVAGERAESGAVTLETLALDAAALDLEGRAALAPDGWPQSFDLDLDIAPVEGETDVLLPVAGPQIRLGGADLTARFDAARGEGWQLSGTIEDFRREAVEIDRVALEGEGVIARGAGEVSGTLTLDTNGLSLGDPTVDRTVGPGLAGSLAFEWERGEPLRLRDIDIGGADYGLTGRMTVEGLEGAVGLRIAPDVTLAADRLSRFSEISGLDLFGAADLDIEGALEPLSGTFDLSLRGTTQDLQTGIAQLDPLLRGTGMVDLVASRDQQGLRVAPLRIQTDAARIEANARLGGENGRVDLEARLTDTGLVLPGLTGATTLTAEATQEGTAWQVSVQGDAPGRTSLRYDGTVVPETPAGPRLSGTLNATTGELSAFSRLAGRRLGGSITLTATGSAAPLEPTFDIEADATSTDLALGVPELDRLLRGRTEIVLDAALGTDGALDIETLRLDGQALAGTLDGRVAETGAALDLDLRLADLGLVVPQFPGAATVSGTARSDGGPWRVDLDASGPGGIDAAVRGTVARDASRLDLAVDGTAPLALANPFIAPRTLDGTARLDLQVNGPPALSSVRGTIRTADAGLALPTQRLSLEGITGSATLNGARAAVDLSGALASGGAVTVQGPIGLNPPFNADLGIRIRNGAFRDPNLYETEADARLTLTGPLAGGARIAGTVTLDQAEIRIPQVGPSYEVLEGLRHVNPPADVLRTLRFAELRQNGGADPEPSSGLPVDLVIRAPDRIFVRGRGLDAELGGTLRLTGTTANLVPIGQFELIRGRLDLLGQRLTLDEGFVALRGSFDPVITFIALAETEGTEVRIAITGVASEPELEITSSPPLPQDEVLALLLFGRDAGSLSALQALQLAAAVRTLSGRGGLGITEQLRSGLGIDDFDISTDAQGNAEARIGAYVSENAYTDVIVGSDGDNEIRLNLDVTDDVTVRGSVGSDGDTSVGVFFERDY